MEQLRGNFEESLNEKKKKKVFTTIVSKTEGKLANYKKFSLIKKENISSSMIYFSTSSEKIKRT